MLHGWSYRPADQVSTTAAPFSQSWKKLHPNAARPSQPPQRGNSGTLAACGKSMASAQPAAAVATHAGNHPNRWGVSEARSLPDDGHPRRRDILRSAGLPDRKPVANFDQAQWMLDHTALINERIRNWEVGNCGAESKLKTWLNAAVGRQPSPAGPTSPPASSTKPSSSTPIAARLPPWERCGVDQICRSSRSRDAFVCISCERVPAKETQPYAGHPDTERPRFRGLSVWWRILFSATGTLYHETYVTRCTARASWPHTRLPGSTGTSIGYHGPAAK